LEGKGTSLEKREKSLLTTKIRSTVTEIIWLADRYEGASNIFANGSLSWMRIMINLLSEQER